MPATIAGSHLGIDTHANRPAANASGQPIGALYSCSTHGLIYKTDGSTWSTYATLGAGTLSDQGVVTYFDFTTAAAPSSPAAGKIRVYSKTGDHLAQKDSAGVETLLDATGGSSTTIVRPSLTPATPTDEFNAALSGWTAVSNNGSFALTNVFGQALDGSRLWLPFGGQHGYIYKSTTNVDQEWQVGGLVVGPRSTQDYFAGIAILDASGDGVGAIFHTGDNTFAVIPITAGLYNGGTAQVTSFNFGYAIGTGTEVWMRLTRVGNTWDAYASVTGGAWEGHVAATISKTITAARKAIGLFSSSAIAAQVQMTADWVHTV